MSGCTLFVCLFARVCLCGGVFVVDVLCVYGMFEVELFICVRLAGARLCMSWRPMFLCERVETVMAVDLSARLVHSEWSREMRLLVVWPW